MEKAVGILGLGCYVPEKVLTNHDLEKIVETSDEWIVERTGIKNRHIAAEGEATSDMSVIAAERALADAGVSPEEIELVIVATASADHAFPSTACLVQDRIGAKNAAAFDLSAGCSGFVYSLGVASQMVKSGLYKKALIIGAETLSRIMNWEDRNTCVLFGDGAGAAVIRYRSRQRRQRRQISVPACRWQPQTRFSRNSRCQRAFHPYEWQRSI